MNKFLFTGNLGQDSEVKYTASGTAVLSFSVAVKSGYGDRAKTTWVRCALFGKRAEGNLSQYLVKGAQVAVSGELELQEWEGQNGKGAAVSVNVDSIDLIGGNNQNQQSNNQPNNQQQGGYNTPQQQQRPQQGNAQQGGGYGQQQAPQHQAPQMNNEYSDSIPF